jgi:hypothetical protein
VLTEEKLDETDARLEHTPRNSLRYLAQEMGSKVSSLPYFQKKGTSICECELFVEVHRMYA